MGKKFTNKNKVVFKTSNRGSFRVLIKISPKSVGLAKNGWEGGSL